MVSGVIVTHFPPTMVTIEYPLRHYVTFLDGVQRFSTDDFEELSMAVKYAAELPSGLQPEIVSRRSFHGGPPALVGWLLIEYRTYGYLQTAYGPKAFISACFYSLEATEQEAQRKRILLNCQALELNAGSNAIQQVYHVERDLVYVRGL